MEWWCYTGKGIVVLEAMGKVIEGRKVYDRGKALQEVTVKSKRMRYSGERELLWKQGIP